MFPLFKTSGVVASKMFSWSLFLKFGTCFLRVNPYLLYAHFIRKRTYKTLKPNRTTQTLSWFGLFFVSTLE